MNLEMALTTILCFQIFQAIYLTILHYEILKLRKDRRDKK